MDTMSEKQYEAAAAFWKRKDAEAVKMPKEELRGWLEDFLKAHSTLALATASSRGVRCTPLEYRWMQERLVILSEGGEKFLHLAENRDVSAAIFDPYQGFGKLASVQVQGTAEVTAITKDNAEEYQMWLGYPASVFSRLDHPMHLVRIRPERFGCTLSGSGRSASMSAARPSKRRGLAPGSPSRCDIKCGRRVQAPGRGLPRRRGSRSA